MSTIVSQTRDENKTIEVKQHRSFSQLKTFLRCPKLYYYDYRSGEKLDTVSESLIVGSAVHAGCECFNVARMEREKLPDVGEMIDMAEVSIEAEAVGREIVNSKGEVANKGELLDMAAKLLRCYRDQVDPSREVLAVEAEFTIQSKFGFPDLIGRIDLVEQDSDGRLVVIDLKTASSKSTADPLHAWQLTLYALSVGRDFKKETVAEVHSLVKTKSPQYVVEEIPISKEGIRRAYANVAATCRAIECCDVSGEWACAYGQACRSCAWRDKCLA